MPISQADRFVACRRSVASTPQSPLWATFALGLPTRSNLTTDGLKAYLKAVDVLDFDADYAMLNKIFARDTYTGPARYSPPVVVGVRTEVIRGNPDPAHISTSFVERQNLTMRMSMRRFTRLTNAFSKKFENHCHALALYFFWYNWTRQHKAHRLSPAMAAGLTDRLMSMTDLANMVDRRPAKTWKARSLQEASRRMSVELILRDEADNQARYLENAASALNAELREIERRKADIDAQLQAVRLAHKRLLNFQPCIGTDFNAPVAGFTKKFVRRCGPSPVTLAMTS